MREKNQKAHEKRKIELMEQCFECFAENGLSSVSIRGLARHCGCNIAVFYTYFTNLDELITDSTEYCMSKVEDDFMELAPKDLSDLGRFLDEIPYWTAENHGKKYRLMYQVYSHPKYMDAGKKFFEGVNLRYTEYAESLEKKLGIPVDVLRPLIFTFVRASVHYALFGDELYLKEQLKLIRGCIKLYTEKHGASLGG